MHSTVLTVRSPIFKGGLARWKDGFYESKNCIYCVKTRNLLFNSVDSPCIGYCIVSV